MKNEERSSPGVCQCCLSFNLAALLRLQHLQQPLAWTSSKCRQGQESAVIQHQCVCVCVCVCVCEEGRGEGRGVRTCVREQTRAQTCVFVY